jgi:hypothetical protein
MSFFYQTRDLEFFDYELYRLPRTRELLRGPRPADLGNLGRMISFVGAAQTFGVMCRYPFPTLLGSMLGRDVLNLGIGGAGPSTFLGPARRKLFDRINRTRACVVQVMSARGGENRLVVNPTRGHKVRYRTDAADVMLRPSEEVYAEILRDYDAAEVLDVVNETRKNWVESYQALAAEIRVPKVLLWISTRSPEYDFSTSNVHALFGGFPQLVNADMLASAAQSFDRLAVATSNEGMPVPLRNRLTGEAARAKPGVPLPNNNYYPSQQMHIHAAQVLEPLLQEYLMPNAQSPPEPPPTGA